MRLAFMGTPDFAVPILEALVEAGHEVVEVFAQPARPTGRGHKVRASPVERRAQELGLAVTTPDSVRDEEAQRRFMELGLDAAVVAAYGQILPRVMLQVPRLGCINVHASLLPRWRGAAPIQRAILAGDATTGISIMQMEAGLDTGPLLLAEAVRIDEDDTTPTLQARLASVGARLLVTTLAGLQSDGIEAVPQPLEGITYATKIDRAEAALDWRRSAVENLRKVRALNPSPGTWFIHGGERIKVLNATAEAGAGPLGNVVDARLGIACCEGLFRPLTLQRPGRAAVPLDGFLNGLAIQPGTILPCPATS